MSHRHHAAFLALSLTTLLAACSNGSPGLLSVDGTTVSKAEVDHRLDYSNAAHQQLADMIQGVALDHYATSHNIVISDAEIAQTRAQIAAAYRPGAFEDQMRKEGLSDDDIKTVIRRHLIVEHAIGDKNAITEKEIDDYYKANPYGFNRPEQVHAFEILVPDLATAQTIEAKLKAGGDFGALVQQYSRDAPSRARGGDLGYFARGTMVPEVSKEAFLQKVGTISAPVKSSFGYHILKVVDHRPLWHPKLSDVHDKVRDRIWQIKVARETPKTLASIMNAAQVTVYDQAFADVPDAIRKSGGSPQ